MAAQMPMMPSHAPPPPPQHHQQHSTWHSNTTSPARSRLDLPLSRRTSERISGDEADDHFTDADSVYGDPNEPISNNNNSGSSSRVNANNSPYTGGGGPSSFGQAAALVSAPDPAILASRLPGRQASFSSSSSSLASSSPRQSVESPSSPNFGAARPFSVSSSIWAGKGALHPSTAANRRRAGQPPLPPLPPSAVATAAAAAAATASSAAPFSSASGVASGSAGRSSSSTSLSALNNGFSHSPRSFPSPLTDDLSGPPRHSFESSSMYSYMDDDTRAGHGPSASPRSPLDWRAADAQGIMPDGTNLPPMPPLPASAVSERRSNSIPTINTSSAASDTLAPLPSKSRGLRPPPIPGTAKRQVLSYEEAEAQEEEELSALQREEDLKGGPTANKRLSAMGPKLKKNSLAPWELGADDDTEASGSMGSSFNPFAKRPSTDIRERDSADIRRAGGAAPATPAKDAVSTGSSSLASNFFGRPSRDYASSQKHDASGVAMESEFTDSTTNSSGFRTSFGDASSSTTAPGPNGVNSQSARSRTKSISSAAAAGVLKGLGLGPTAGGVGPGGHAPSVPMGMPITANGGPVGSVSTRGASISGGEVSMPGSAPSSMGKKSKLAKALRLGNSMSAATSGGGSGVQTNHHAPVGMYPSHPRESGSGLSHDDSAIVSPTRPISNASHPHGSSSHQAPSLSTQQQQQQQQGGRTSMSAPHSPVSYSPRGASPPLPPLMSLSQSAIRQNSSATTGGGGGGIGGSSGDDTVLMSPTSLSASGGQRSSSSTTAHTSSSLGGGGSGGGGGGLKALKLQPRVPASAAGGPAAIAWLHRGSTGDGFGGAGGPLTPHLGQAAGASASGPAADGEDGDWRKPVLLSPRTTSLGVGPPLPGGGVSMSMSTSSSSGSSLTSPSRTRMPTSPTATRLGSVGASASASSAGPRATDSLSLPLSSLPSGGVTQSDSVLTITDPRGGLGGPERYASPPPVGAGPQGHGLPGTAAAGALGLTASSSGGDQTEANANASNDSVGTNANGQLPSAQSFPRPGQAEGVAYRLISLEEARANQAREREERNARSGRGKAVGVGGGGGGGGAAGPGASQMGPRPGSSGGVMASSSSSGAVSRSYSASNGMGPGGIPGLPSSSSQGHASGPQDEHHDQLHAHRNSNGPATGISSGSGGGSGAGSGSGSSGGKGLKNKKSGGFLRMFNKDRSGDHAPPMPGMSNNRTGSVEEGRNTFSEDHEAGRGSVGRGSASTASGAPPPPKFTVSSDASGGRGGGGALGGGGPPTLGGLSVASAPALKLRPMSSMLSGFSADLLDPTLTETGLSSAVASASSATAAASANANANSAASASGGAAGPGGAASATSTSSLAPGGGGAAALTSPTASKSPTLLSPVEGNLHLANSRSTSMTSLSSGALGEDSKLGGGGGRTARAAVGVGTSVDSEAGVRKASLSTAGASAGGVRTDKVLVGGIGKPVSAAVSRQASEHSDGVSAGQQQQQQQQQQQSQGLVASAGLASPTTSDTGGSFVNTSTGSGNGNGKLPAWKARALELEAKIVEYAAELAELRNTYFTQAAAEAAAEDEENGGGGAGTADGLSSFPEGGGTGTLTPVRGAAGGNKELATPTPGSASASSQDGAGGSTSTGTGTGTGGTIIPPCALCGCACAEQRRQQALNAAAVLKGISVLDRGRAIKPGLIQSSRFGSYALRS